MPTDQIFVCGTGRSGTTIFTKLLGCHPDIWAFKWESQLFSGPAGLADLVLNQFSLPMLDRFEERVKGHLFKRNVRGTYDAGLFEIVSQEALETALAAMRQQIGAAGHEEEKIAACRTFADAIFLPPMQADGARCWCEKTPRNLLFASVIQQIYPQARFIHVVRDGRDVVTSMLTRGFWPVASTPHFPETRKFSGEVGFERVLPYWSTLLDIARDQEEKVGSSHWLNVRYEDLLGNLPKTFDRICDFLEVDRHREVDAEMQRLIKPESAAGERVSLSSEEREALTAASWDNLLRYGYSL